MPSTATASQINHTGASGNCVSHGIADNPPAKPSTLIHQASPCRPVVAPASPGRRPPSRPRSSVPARCGECRHAAGLGRRRSPRRRAGSRIRAGGEPHAESSLSRRRSERLSA
jgi:hypothetical protein